MKIKILLALLLFWVSAGAFAQKTVYQFSHLDIKNGLSHNQISCIYKDHKGFMWFGTLSGLNKYDGYKFTIYKHTAGDASTLDDDYILNIAEGPENKLWIETRTGFNIYDPATEKFSHNSGEFLNRIHITNAYISAIKKDRFGNFWFLHHTLGVYKYDPLTKKTIHIGHRDQDTSSLYKNVVSDITIDSGGKIWLVYSEGILERLDPLNYRVNYRTHLRALPPGLSTTYHLYVDDQDDIWAFVPSYSAGVYYLNTKKFLLKHIQKGNQTGDLNNDVVSNVIQDDKGIVWIATDHGGVNVLSKRDWRVRYLLNREDDPKTIGQNSVTLLYKDDTDIIWLGTYKRGVSYYHPGIIKFANYTHHLSDPASLPFGDVNNFAEDIHGNLWIGTNGGGLIYWDRNRGSYRQYLHNTSDKKSLSNNVIVCMTIDHEQKLWIGTYYGGLDCYDGKTFVHYKHDDAVPGSISENRICAITEDSEQNLWVGTISAGLNKLNSKRQTFTHYQYHGDADPNTIHSNYISAVLEDHHKNIWIVTAYGVDVLMKKSNHFIHYLHNDKDPESLINNNTNNILEDKQGFIWISTREGLNIFDPVSGKFTAVSKQDGLPDNTIIDLQEDENHNIWVSTPNGLSNIMVDRQKLKLGFRFINYNEADGLQGREFSQNSSYKTREGELLFGGGNGFNLFRPADIRFTKSVPNLIFADFEIFNRHIAAGDKVDGDVVLSRSITETQELKLRHSENVFSITFAALNYFNPDKIKLQYTLQGFDKGWITIDNKERKATYTNLDAGNYVFKVRALNNEFWNSKEIRLKIIIMPPFWKTIWAYLLYAFLSVGAVFFLRHRGIRKIKAQFSIEKEREEAQRMHDLDRMKIKFFTNISHEFRTPLSLIMAPVDKMSKHITDTESRKQLQMISRNAHRLLNLVNQLMDFRKMEYQELKLHRKSGDIISFIRELSFLFSDVADQKKIRFVFDTDIDIFYTSFDHDKIERIVFNLLSNAYKFTPDGGRVSVILSLRQQIDFTDCQLEIRVADTGIGIPADRHGQIFEPFFQHDIPKSMLNQGSGIGLSIVREFVKLHGGDIILESEHNQGSCFTVLLPLSQPDESLSGDVPAVLRHETNKPDAVQTTKAYRPKEKCDDKKPTILLVEDNEDFRFYIKDNLNQHFTVIEAENGKKGWQKTLAQHPNLVVSDISMPEMNGIDLCLKIRNDARTAHIPVILLTAITGEKQQLKGLETGAADYLTKPFNFEILLSKIKNILSQQADMRKTYQKQVDITSAPDVKVTDEPEDSADELFIKKVFLLIDNNLSNPNFSVEELSSEMFVSRYTLYKKILQMTGKAPNELVRSMRLKRAAQLLMTGHLTISKICYKVGFRSQKYFVRTFKAEFNSIPSRYRDQADVKD